MDLFEHEKMLENYMYKKGFQYCFDHYGVILEGSVKNENKKLHKVIKELEDRLDEKYKTLKAVRQSWYYCNRTSKELRKKLKNANLEIKSIKSKWYIKLFRLLK